MENSYKLNDQYFCVLILYYDTQYTKLILA